MVSPNLRVGISEGEMSDSSRELRVVTRDSDLMGASFARDVAEMINRYGRISDIGGGDLLVADSEGTAFEIPEVSEMFGVRTEGQSFMYGRRTVGSVKVRTADRGRSRDTL